jgi:hypothetical protein
VEIYNNRKLGGMVPIFFDKTNGTFSAEMDGVLLQHSELLKLRALIDTQMSSRTTLEWLPMIEVEFGDRWGKQSTAGKRKDNDLRCDVTLGIRRQWIARKPDGKWLSANWDNDEPTRLMHSSRFDVGKFSRSLDPNNPTREFSLPWVEEHESTYYGDEMSSPTYYLPYTEALWIGLISVIMRLNDLQGALVDLIGSEKSRKQLATHAAGLLPAPKRPESRR